MPNPISAALTVATARFLTRLLWGFVVALLVGLIVGAMWESRRKP